MIALDSSALIAVAAGEPMADACADVLERSRGQIVMAAATLTEALIVGHGRNISREIDLILMEIEPAIEPVTADFARRAAAAYVRWGKGYHSARLNFGDSFSYAVAELHDCPLLYIGGDFVRTDIRSALDAGSR